MRSRSARLYRYTLIVRTRTILSEKLLPVASGKWRVKESRQTTCSADGANFAFDSGSSILLVQGSEEVTLMTSTTRRVLEAVFWFVVGHLSCAVLHHMHGR